MLDGDGERHDNSRRQLLDLCQSARRRRALLAVDVDRAVVRLDRLGRKEAVELGDRRFVRRRALALGGQPFEAAFGAIAGRRVNAEAEAESRRGVS